MTTDPEDIYPEEIYHCHLQVDPIVIKVQVDVKME